MEIISEQQIWSSPNRSIKVNAEYQNRTATTVDVRLTWFYILNSSGYSSYAAYLTPTINETVESKITMKGKIPSNWYGNPLSGTTDWYTVPLDASATRIPISIVFSTDDPDDSDVVRDGNISVNPLLSVLGNIPAFNDVSTITLVITKYDNRFSQNLEVKLKNKNVSLAKRVNISNGYGFSFSESELASLYENNVDLKFVPLVFELETLNGTTSLGKTSVETVVIISNAQPIFTDFDYEDVNSKTNTLTGNNQVVIKGYSTLKVTIPVNKKAIPQKGAIITSYYIDDVSKDYSSTSDVSTELQKYSKQSITVKTVDSRANQTSVSKNLTTINYEPIAITSTPTIKRINAVGEETRINLSGTFWNDNFGEISNSLSISYKYREIDSIEEYTNGMTTINPVVTNNSFTVNDVAILGDTNTGFDVSKSYEVVLIINDKLSKYEAEIPLMAGTPAIKLEGNKIIFANNIFPVGSIYLSVNDTNPSEWYGGTWSLIAKGRTLVGVDPDDEDFDTSEKLIGQKYQELRALIGAFDANISSIGYCHAPKVDGQDNYSSYGLNATFISSGELNYAHSTFVMQKDNSQPTTIQPSFTCYIWCRTA